MNLPSLDKYEKTVKKGGTIFVDSTLIERKVERDDVRAFYIPCTKMAQDMGTPNLANIILLGKVLKECPEIGMAGMEDALKKVVAKHPEMYEVNLKAVEAGYNYQ